MIYSHQPLSGTPTTGQTKRQQRSDGNRPQRHTSKPSRFTPTKANAPCDNIQGKRNVQLSLSSKGRWLLEEILSRAETRSSAGLASCQRTNTGTYRQLPPAYPRRLHRGRSAQKQPDISCFCVHTCSFRTTRVFLRSLRRCREVAPWVALTPTYAFRDAKPPLPR